MGEFKNHIVKLEHAATDHEEITIEDAVKKMVVKYGDDENTVITALAGLISLNYFQVVYKEDKVTIPDQESVHVECYMPPHVLSEHLLEVAKNGWGKVNVDPSRVEIELITKTKDKNGAIIVPQKNKGDIDPVTGEVATYTQSEVRDIKRVVERYTGGLRGVQGVAYGVTWGNFLLYASLLCQNAYQKSFC